MPAAASDPPTLPAGEVPVVPSRPHALRRGELLSAASALLLLVLTFAFQWYGIAGVPGHGSRSALSGSENAWHGLTTIRWVMLLTMAVAIGSVLLHISQRLHGARTSTGGL